jgi:hypothetical protein
MTDAFDLVVAMPRRSFGDELSRRPTELFSEGWVLRLILESAYEGHGGLPFEFAVGARWYSEARLSSAFAPRHRGVRTVRAIPMPMELWTTSDSAAPPPPARCSSSMPLNSS